MKNAADMTDRELHDSLWEFLNDLNPFALADWMKMVNCPSLIREVEE